eukprot:scaffold1606_cov177-Pinguiococcus_pyrenoidosus.AAC.4
MSCATAEVLVTASPSSRTLEKARLASSVTVVVEVAAALTRIASATFSVVCAICRTSLVSLDALLAPTPSEVGSASAVVAWLSKSCGETKCCSTASASMPRPRSCSSLGVAPAAGILPVSVLRRSPATNPKLRYTSSTLPRPLSSSSSRVWPALSIATDALSGPTTVALIWLVLDAPRLSKIVAVSSTREA